VRQQQQQLLRQVLLRGRIILEAMGRVRRDVPRNAYCRRVSVRCGWGGSERRIRHLSRGYERLWHWVSSFA
jgi:hypothetical protein